MHSTSIVTAAQMRWIDRFTIEQGVEASQLMDRAGHEVATAVLEVMPDYGRVVIVTGAGNNGGDGFAAACYLRAHRIPVTIVALTPIARCSDVARGFAAKATETGAKIREACPETPLSELERWLARAVMVVDAIFGTGLGRPLEGSIADVVNAINASDRPVLSVDIASGICADSGRMLGAAVRADYTLPIGSTKWGHWFKEGRDFTGRLLTVADIGITDAAIRQSWSEACECEDHSDCQCVNSASVIDRGFLDQAWPKRSRQSHKGCYGHLWIFGGSRGFVGAPQLAGLGAYAAGAGLVSIACPDDLWPVVAAGQPEIMVHPESSAQWQGGDALVAGPGWGCAQSALLSQLLEAAMPLVIDADALNLIAGDPQLQRQLQQRPQLTVMTPHPGEAARLLDTTACDVQNDRKQSVMALTNRYRCWVVLKGSETLIASPGNDIYLNPFGSAQLAVAGSGDLLAGMIGTLLARSTDSAVSVDRYIAAAVALHGLAGERENWFLAGELVRIIADLRQQVERGR